jgi:hypothetical protein
VKTDVMLLVVLTLTSIGGLAQSAGPPQTAPRVTPLGTQRPKPQSSNRPDKKNEPDNRERLEEIVERAVQAHGGRQLSTAVKDAVAEGLLTFFGGNTAGGTIDVTVTRKGSSRLQRVLKRGDGQVVQGSDGTSTWESFDGMTALAPGGLAKTYIESQTARGLDMLFEAQNKGLPIRDAGRKGNARVLELDTATNNGTQNSPTRYFIDDATSRVTRIEFITGEAKDILGKSVATTESYVFSDFRSVQGVPTPFRVERFIDALKIEESQFTSVRYNTSVKDDLFKP